MSHLPWPLLSCLTRISEFNSSYLKHMEVLFISAEKGSSLQSTNAQLEHQDHQPVKSAYNFCNAPLSHSPSSLTHIPVSYKGCCSCGSHGPLLTATSVPISKLHLLPLPKQHASLYTCSYFLLLSFPSLFYIPPPSAIS